MSNSHILKDANSHSANRSGFKIAKPSRGLVEIEANLCKECGLCVEACPAGVLRISERLNKMGYHPVEYTGKGCTGCGICFYICPEPGTITVHKKIKTLR